MIKIRLNPDPSYDQTYNHHFLLLNIFFSIICSSAHATCYNPNGIDKNADLGKEIYQPCDAGDEHSMCCALNRPDADKCRNDGLCFSTWDSNLWRESCTDPTWKSSSCIKLCVSGTGQYNTFSEFDQATTDSTVTHCDNGSYCCGNGTIGDACCREGRGFFVLNGEAVSNTASSSSITTNLSASSRNELSHTISAFASSVVPQASSSTTKNLSASSPNDLSHTTGAFASSVAPQASSKLTSPATSSSASAAHPSDKAGLIVGGVIGGVAVLSLSSGMIAWIWMNHNRQNSQSHGTPQTVGTGQADPEEYVVSQDNEIHELNAHGSLGELDGRPIEELDHATTSIFESSVSSLAN